MYSVMHQPEPRNFYWANSTSSCSDAEDMDSDAGFDAKSDEDSFSFLDNLMKPVLTQQRIPQVPPVAPCSETAASLSSAFKRDKGVPQQSSLGTVTIKSELGSCFDENNEQPLGNAQMQLPHPLQDSFQLSSQQQYSPGHRMDSGQSQHNSVFGMTSANDGTTNSDQIGIYRDMILKHLVQEIGSTCSKLYLPSNPLFWNGEQTNRWVAEMCHQFQLPTLREPLNMTGRALLTLSIDEFTRKVPEGGDTLHAQLHLWKTAHDSCQQPEDMSTAGSIEHHASSDSISSWDSPKPNVEANEIYGFLNDQNAYGNFDQSNSDSANMNMYYGMQSQHNNYQPSVPQNIPFDQNRPHPLNNNNNASPRSFFAAHQQVLPSPSDSDVSSSASTCIQDGDDDCSEAQYPMGLSSYMPPSMCAQVSPPMNGYGMQMHNGMPMGPLPLRAPASNTNAAYSRNTGTVHLWHFIRELLDQPEQYSSCVRWVDRGEGTFKIESSHHLARIWGQRKNRSQMNYDKLSRSLRQYYKKGIIQKPEKKQRLVYKFLPPYNL